MIRFELTIGRFCFLLDLWKEEPTWSAFHILRCGLNWSNTIAYGIDWFRSAEAAEDNGPWVKRLYWHRDVWQDGKKLPRRPPAGYVPRDPEDWKRYDV